jgi:hypothetical protein
LTNETYGGDSNLWTGVLLSSLALEYSLTHDRALLKPISKIVDAYEWLEYGHDLFPHAPGYIPRAIELDQGLKSDPSGDQYTGILVGYDLTLRFVDDAIIRGRIIDQANRIGKRMQDNWYFIFKPQGGLSDRGAETVQWEYTWGQMLYRITGNSYPSKTFSLGEFWDRLTWDEQKCILEWTTIAVAALSPVPSWFMDNITGAFWSHLVDGVWGFVGTIAPALVPAPATNVFLGFVAALFKCLREAPEGILLHWLFGNAMKRHHASIDILAGNIPDRLNRLVKVYTNIKPFLKANKIPAPDFLEKLRDPVRYYNYHITFLSTFGALYGSENPDEKLNELYDIRIIKKSGGKDRNPLFALIVQALYKRMDTFDAVRILDEPGIFPVDYLPWSRDERSAFHFNYAWQTDVPGRYPMNKDLIEWPGLDYIFPTILRAHLTANSVPYSCSPAIAELI